MRTLLKFLYAILPSKTFELGEGRVIRYTLIELKWFFSIYLHRIETMKQDRYHTHAFNALVFILQGEYFDEIKHGIGPNKPLTLHRFQAGDVRWIPREMNHRLLEAQPETVSLLITGPYSTIWTEEVDDGTLRILTSGRKPLGEIKVDA